MCILDSRKETSLPDVQLRDVTEVLSELYRDSNLLVAVSGVRACFESGGYNFVCAQRP